MNDPVGIEPVDESRRPAVWALLEEVERHDDHPALSEAKVLELSSGRATGLVACDGEMPVGYAHLSARDATWDIQVAVHPAHRDGSIRGELSRAGIAAVEERGGRPRLWAFRAGPLDDELAAGLGLVAHRELRQMRRPLPHPDDLVVPDGYSLREFAPGSDDGPFLEVNGRSFADHPEQGGWDRSALSARLDAAWFDPAGFLVAESDDAPDGLAGFCWTKIHERSGRGEIYVIGTDPAHQGRGLGRALVLAGLDALARRGAPSAFLYVEEDNTGAIGMYEALGFTTDHTDRVYVPGP